MPNGSQKHGTRTAQIRGLAADGQVLAQSIPTGVHAGALVIPFGGRVKVGVYKNSKDAKADPSRQSAALVMTPLLIVGGFNSKSSDEIALTSDRSLDAEDLHQGSH